MRFAILHRTHYRYAGRATECYMEARLTPVSDDRQKLVSRKLTIAPESSVNSYVDAFGNTVEAFAIIKRHRELLIENTCEVETSTVKTPSGALGATVSEARQIWRGQRLELYEWLMPSPAVQMSASVNRLANQFFKPKSPLGPSIDKLMAWIHKEFRYVPGSTTLDTPIAEVLQSRKGVCQDFAQTMIAILRSAEIPARYVAGYIETDSQRRAAESKQPARLRRLIGASESHAWVEVFLPGRFWWGLDPTNNCTAGERHVKVSVGRDYHDSTPTRGVFKNTRTEGLSVTVTMQRLTS
jgi:transglutaminase-like putative cysteine protease